MQRNASLPPLFFFLLKKTYTKPRGGHHMQRNASLPPLFILFSFSVLERQQF